MSTTVVVAPPLATKVNFWTHLVFPARTLYKDMVYWPCEIAAGIIILIYIIQFDLIDVKNANGDTVKMYKPDPQAPVGPYGFLGPSSPAYQTYPSNLLNREYAWICLCYAIKHFFYLIDTAMWVNKKFCRPMDLVAPFLNLGLWVLWGLYGWLNVYDQIHAGEYTRVTLDMINASSINDNIKQPLRDNVNAYYNATAKWVWLWVPTGVVCLIIFALWIVNIFMRRSSGLSNVAISTWLIPLQLFFLHLFLKGWWIKSNAVDIANNPNQSNQDIFEARYVFPIIYFASWIGLLFAVICVFKSIIDMRYHLTNFFKFLLYALFWVSGFLWCLCMDNTLYHLEVHYWSALIITQIVCLGCALFIGIISIFQKFREMDKFVERHNQYYSWAQATDGAVYYN